MDAFNNKMKEISDINDKVNEMIPGGESGPDYECKKTRLNNQVVGNGPDHDDPKSSVSEKSFLLKPSKAT